MLIKPGTAVKLNTPDNLQLHGAPGVVEVLMPWGAFVKTEAAATGEFRALYSEMIVEGDPELLAANQEAALLDTPVGLKVPLPAVAKQQNGHQQPGRGEGRARKGSSPPPPVRQAGYTGDVCDTCGGARMVRAGTCTRCEDCGTSGGCG
jgi:hypothetical protein